MDLSRYVAAVLGGDGREVELVRQLRAAGATVRTCGLPAGAEAAAGAPGCATVAEAAVGAHIVVCPIPIPQADGAIFAPHAGQRLVVDTAALAGMAPGGVLITGRASPQMQAAARELGLQLHEYEHDEELMILRAPAIAEGAIKIAIEHTEVTLHDNPCLVVGFGKIGPALCRSLLGLGARVTVAARNPLQRARAWEMGCAAVNLDQLVPAARGAAVVFNIAPAPLFTRAVLAQLEPQTVLVDLTAPPGGIDFTAAGALGLKAIWGRGLGGRAPRTVGRSQWLGVSRIIRGALGV